jgi:hypothetical protein
MRMRALLARTLVTGGLIVGTGAAGVAAAAASPSTAPSALKGSFFDCSNGESGTFVVNSGQASSSWNVAHLTFTSGGTGIFVPTAMNLLVNGIPEGPVTKGSVTGSVTCSIQASQPGFTLTGMVTGNIVHTG